MKKEFYIYTVSCNKTGDSRTVVVNDYSDNLCFSLDTGNGTHASYDSEAYHLSSWASEHGFKVKTDTVALDMENKAITNWTTTEEDYDKSVPLRKALNALTLELHQTHMIVNVDAVAELFGEVIDDAKDAGTLEGRIVIQQKFSARFADYISKAKRPDLKSLYALYAEFCGLLLKAPLG